MDKRYEKVMERFDEEIRNGQVRVHRALSSSIYNDFKTTSIGYTWTVTTCTSSSNKTWNSTIPK